MPIAVRHRAGHDRGARARDRCAAHRCDVLVFSGGSSVGERDLILDVIGRKRRDRVSRHRREAGQADGVRHRSTASRCSGCRAIRPRACRTPTCCSCRRCDAMARLPPRHTAHGDAAARRSGSSRPRAGTSSTRCGSSTARRCRRSRRPATSPRCRRPTATSRSPRRPTSSKKAKSSTSSCSRQSPARPSTLLVAAAAIPSRCGRSPRCRARRNRHRPRFAKPISTTTRTKLTHAEQDRPHRRHTRTCESASRSATRATCRAHRRASRS